MIRRGGLAVGAVGWLLSAALVWAAEDAPPGIPTTVVVRVVGSHAMALGDPVGGDIVTIKDAETGTILASGKQTGSSGDLRSIMATPHLQVEQIYSVRGTAAFTTTLYLTKPTVVEVTGEGPLKFPRALRRASKTVLLYPGKPMMEDGIVLMLYGLIVQIEAPTLERPLGIGDGGTLRATVKMMCDCIVEPFGNWDSRKMNLYGEMQVGDQVIAKIDLYHKGPKGLFQGDFLIPKSLKGQKQLTLRVVAADAQWINVGYDELTYPLVPWEQSRDATGREIPPLSQPSQ